MKDATTQLLMGVCIILLLVILFYKCGKSTFEPMDPTLRLAAGGLAGPSIPRDYLGREGYSSPSKKKCGSCMSTEEFEAQK